MPSSPSVFSSEEYKKLIKKKVPVMTEKELTKQICAYIKHRYPEVYFFTDPSGMFQKSWGAKITLKNNRSKHAQLDLIILHATENWHGAVIELKREGEKILKKNTNECVSPHVQDQMDSLLHLGNNGYFTAFGIGYEQTKELIDKYLNP